MQVKRCEVCQRSKRKFDKPAPSLHPIPVTDTWNKVGIDLITMPESSSGNRYCITLTDYFSKWAEAAPMPTKEAVHVANFLYKMFLRHGCPQEIISDQGREFCNQLVDLLEELTGYTELPVLTILKRMDWTKECFERQQLSPFPAADCKQRKCRTKHFVVTMYCYCRMPSSFDDNMIKCDNCSKWFHCRCAEVPPLSSPDTWHCCVTCS